MIPVISFILLSLILPATWAQQSCAGRDAGAEWRRSCLQLSGTEPSLDVFDRHAAGCQRQYYNPDILIPEQNIYGEMITISVTNCTSCLESNRDESEKGQICKSICGRSDEIGRLEKDYFERQYCQYIECMVSSPCSDNAQQCDKVDNICRLAADIGNDRTLASASDISTLCQAVLKIGGVGNLALAATPAGAALGTLLAACAAVGPALTTIGIVASSACNSCNDYLTSLECPNAKVTCPLPPPPLPRKRKRQNVEEEDVSTYRDITTGDCGKDSEIDISYLRIDMFTFCAQIEGALEGLYAAEPTSMGALGAIEDLPTSDTCRAIGLAQKAGIVKEMVGDEQILYQSTACVKTEEVEAPLPSQRRRRLR